MKITMQVTMTRKELDTFNEAVGMFGDELMKYPSKSCHHIANKVTEYIEECKKHYSPLYNGPGDNFRVTVKAASRLQSMLYMMSITDKITFDVTAELTEEAQDLYSELYVELGITLGRLSGAVLSITDTTKVKEIFSKLTEMSMVEVESPTVTETSFKINPDGSETLVSDDEVSSDNLTGDEEPIIMVHKVQNRNKYYVVLGNLNDKGELVVDGVARGKAKLCSAHTVTGDFSDYLEVHVDKLPYNIHHLTMHDKYEDAVKSVIERAK